MTFSMNLISKTVIDDILISYYEGIDFLKVHNHPKDGSDGLMIIFIENWQTESSLWRREQRINNILGEKLIDFDIEDINNDYISIYQAENIGIELMYHTIKSKLENKKSIQDSWIPIGGIDSGAWNLRKSQNIN